ncbi:MAG: hypothetical protein KAY09_03220, partial [Nitrospira sp.]|nr:hypothetical protein [Nitrospira sp.]
MSRAETSLMACVKPKRIRQAATCFITWARAGLWLFVATTGWWCATAGVTVWAEPLGEFHRGAKQITEHNVKSLVGPSVQVDEQGLVSLAWMEEEKDVRSVLYARSLEPGGPMGAPVRINRPEDVPYWRQEAPALVVQGEDVFVTWGLAHPKATPQQPFATELRLSRSADRGKTFQPSVLVNDD